MNNKRLEDRLRKYGEEYVNIVRLIEKCEAGNVGEIRIEKNSKITNSVVLDKMIFTYLKKLKITVVYYEEEVKATNDDKPQCDNVMHRILGTNMKKSSKVKTLKKSLFKMLKIDISSFAICPDCGNIEEIK